MMGSLIEGIVERVLEPRERGPWPQPAPGQQDEMAPGVVHIPLTEQLSWNWHVGLRYMRQVLLTTPAAMLWAARNRGLKPVSDARFAEVLTDGILSKFVAPLEPADAPTFADDLAARPGATWFKSDLTPMELISEPRQGSVAPSLVLWEQTARHRYVVRAIAVGSEVFRPGGGPRWEAAKYFALQGAGVLTTILMHPLLHFPSDAINAVTRTRLPEGHIVRQLILPHLHLELAVNNAVLHSYPTVLRPGWVYSPYPGTLRQHMNVVSVLWRGYPFGRPSSTFPRYIFPLQKPVVHSDYGDFLGAYWDTFYDFVTSVVKLVDTDDDDVRCWAEHIAHWLPGFPDGSAIFQGDNLARALTSALHTVSVGHTADHWIYHYDVDPREVPFRLRLPVPGKSAAYQAPEPRKLVTWYDNVNYRMCSEMFFKPFSVTRLQGVNYQFSQGILRRANDEFLAALAGTERKMQQQGSKIYVPLSEIACSVQFLSGVAMKGNAKGLLFLYLKDYATELNGERAWSSLVASAGPADRAALEGLLLAAGWYPIGTWNRVLAAFLTGHAPVDPMGAMKLFGEYLGERELNTFVRFVLKMGSPEFMLRRTDFLWRRYFDTGTFGAEEAGSRRWRLWLEAPCDEDLAVARYSCGNGPGPWLERGLHLCGARQGKVQKIACRWSGARRCEFVATW